MTYVFVAIAPVPIDKKEDYIAVSKAFGDAFTAHGATRYLEVWEEDIPEGEVTSFPMSVKREPGEAVVMSWTEWSSKADADNAWEKMQQDTEMMKVMQSAPMDGKRMIFGGFSVIYSV